MTAPGENPMRETKAGTADAKRFQHHQPWGPSLRARGRAFSLMGSPGDSQGLNRLAVKGKPWIPMDQLPGGKTPWAKGQPESPRETLGERVPDRRSACGSRRWWTGSRPWGSKRRPSSWGPTGNSLLMVSPGGSLHWGSCGSYFLS